VFGRYELGAGSRRAVGVDGKLGFWGNGSSVSGGRDLGDAEGVDVAVSAKTGEGPAQISEGVYAKGTTGRDDSKQYCGPMGTLGAASKEAVESNLGDLLVLAL